MELQGIGLEFGGEQRRQLHLADPSGQRFGRLPQQVARGAAQQQEAARPAVCIDFRAQRGKPPGDELHLAEYNETIALAGKNNSGCTSTARSLSR